MVSFANNIRDVDYSLLHDEARMHIALHDEKHPEANVLAPSVTEITTTVRTVLGGFFSDEKYPRTDSEWRAAKLQGWGEIND